MIQHLATSLRAFEHPTLAAQARYSPVLIVDDNDMTRELLARRLERANLRSA